MKDTIYELLVTTAITGFVIYVVWIAYMFITTRKRYRVTCECGHRERAYSLTSAKWSASEHMMRCKGKAVVSPTPPADIAKAHEQA
jgi:hypothetical protein